MNELSKPAHRREEFTVPSAGVPSTKAMAAILILLCHGFGLNMQGFADDPGEHRVFASSRTNIDEILKRTYSPDVPMGCVGNRLWASSPQGWCFADDVHWLFLSNLHACELQISDSAGSLVPAEATYFPSHIHMEGAQRAITASASFTFSKDGVQNPLVKPYREDRRWTCWSSKSREDWFAVDYSVPRRIRGLRLFFYDDSPAGGVRPPESVRFEYRNGGSWKPLNTLEQFPAKCSSGENRFLFAPIEVEKIRAHFKHAGKDFYTGIFGWDPIADEGESHVAIVAPTVRIYGDKWITSDDCLVSIVRLENSGAREAKLKIRPEAPLAFPPDQISEAILTRGDGGRSTLAAAPITVRLQGRDVIVNLFLVAENFASLKLDKSSPGAPELECAIEPGRTASVYLGMSFADSPEIARRVAIRWLRGKTPLDSQVAEYRQWFDENAAFFACSDPTLEKMYQHRLYLLRKNLLDPKIGKLRNKAFSEGRWRSSWYPNVISYGAGHQIREARWLRDHTIWSGHLQTFVENLKKNGVTPAQVKPNGPTDFQYTDWISSTAWDGFLVHPDRTFLGDIADRLAANVRGWQKTYDGDGDGLLWVDSHWWTGMEWQPSFFAFSDFKTDPKDRSQPEKREKLDRIDLTSYNFGNAVAVAKVYREIGKPEKAAEFDNLADKIRKAMLAKMWDEREQFFYSKRNSDGAKADVKEVIGIYPFYFELPPPGQGFERAWSSIVDPEQFWTPWPVASTSKKCKAYSQDHWPTGPGGSGCMWNGPTWPHANSIVLTAMANTLRNYPQPLPVTRERFWELFQSFTKAQFFEQKIDYPWTGEFYNGDTGRWKTAERDYFHSTWLDILIPEIVGIRPRNDDTLVIDTLLPTDKLDYFILDGQHYRGHDITVVWDSPRNVHDFLGDGRRGLDVYIDRKLVASAPGLQRIETPLPKARP